MGQTVWGWEDAGWRRSVCVSIIVDPERAQSLSESYRQVVPAYTRLGIISDVHGNLQALLAVAHQLSAEGVEKVICLGDVVGYGANPKECVGFVKATGYETILGNHDRPSCGLPEPFEFNEWAQQALEWTKTELTDQEKSWLSQLSLTYESPGMLCVHSSPRDPNAMRYAFEEDGSIFTCFDQRVCFIGHSHVPLTYKLMVDGTIQPDSSEEIALGPDVLQAIVNVGAVGQPRDNDNRSAYGIVDLSDWPAVRVEVKRTIYHIEAATAEIRRRGLPEYFAVRLALGA